jgi:hypothetical protein
VWVRFDDGTHDNPKIWDLSDGAFRLWFSAICYAQKWLTDGVVSGARVPQLIPKFQTKYVTELLDAGCWERRGKDYLIHDFTEINKTKAHWLKRRTDEAARLADWRARNGKNTR